MSNLDALLEDLATPEVELRVPLNILVKGDIHLRVLDEEIRSRLARDELDGDFAALWNLT